MTGAEFEAATNDMRWSYDGSGELAICSGSEFRLDGLAAIIRSGIDPKSVGIDPESDKPVRVSIDVGGRTLGGRTVGVVPDGLVAVELDIRPGHPYLFPAGKIGLEA